MSVAVVGGGITGLATAWFLRRYAPDLSVTLYEAGNRLGGKIRTEELGGVAVEHRSTQSRRDGGADGAAWCRRRPPADRLW